MQAHSFVAVLSTVLAAAVAAAGAEPDSLVPQLEPLRPLLGKTWKGVLKTSTPDMPVADVMRCERALNGKAIRAWHSINDGAYGGETIYMWDEKKQAVVFYYFTTAGFMTTGQMKFEDGKMISHETVSGKANGVTEVRGASELLPDGTLRITAEYFKDGQWQPGRKTDYHEAPQAEVIFR